MKLEIELNEADVKKLVLAHLSGILNKDLSVNDVLVQVKSTQNYKSEWENAAFRAVVRKNE